MPIKFKLRRGGPPKLPTELKNLLELFEIDPNWNYKNIVSHLMAKAHKFILNNEFDAVEKVIDALFSIGNLYKDNNVVAKAYLLLGEIKKLRNEDPLPILKKALVYAKKSKNESTLLSAKLQLALEYFEIGLLKESLKLLKSIKADKLTSVDYSLIYFEILSRVYWELNDFKKGFESTYKWFSLLKEHSDDLPSIFITIVYLITVKNSIQLKKTKEELEKIEEEISLILKNMSSNPALFKSILLNLDILYAKSLMLVSPSILREFALNLLKSSEDHAQEYYLAFCNKLADLFYYLNDFDMALTITEKAIMFSKNRRYKHLIEKYSRRKIEIQSLTFYFAQTEPFLDYERIDRVEIIDDGSKNTFQAFSLVKEGDKYPSTNYSDFMAILRKSKVDRNKRIKIPNITQKEHGKFFVLHLILSNQEHYMLFQESYYTQYQDGLTLRATLSPYYSAIAILLPKNDTESNNRLQEIFEKILIAIQKGMNCPAAKVEIILPEDSNLEFFNFWLIDKDFKKLKQTFMSNSIQLKNRYKFANNANFLQLFQSDPITIFDLMLRPESGLRPLSFLLKEAYSFAITEKELKSYFNDFFELFINVLDNHYVKDLFLNYAVLHLTKETENLLTSKDDVNIQRLHEIRSTLKVISTKLTGNKKLESLWYILLIDFILLIIDFKLNEKDRAHESYKRMIIESKNEEYKVLVKGINTLSRLATECNKVLMEEFLSVLGYLCDKKEINKVRILLQLLVTTHFGITNKKVTHGNMSINTTPCIKTLKATCFSKKIKAEYCFPYLWLAQFFYENNYPFVALDLVKNLVEFMRENWNNLNFSENKKDFIFINACALIFDITQHSEGAELSPKEKEQLLETLVEKLEMIKDKELMLLVIIEKIKLHLSKNEYSIGEHYCRILEEFLHFYYEDVIRSNHKILSLYNDIKLKLSKQHFT